MKKILLSVVTILSVVFNMSADRIVTNLGEEIECKVEKISETELVYTSSPSTVLRALPLSSILYVQYDNGEKELFKKDVDKEQGLSLAELEADFFPIKYPVNIPTDYSGLPGSERAYRLFDYYDENGVRGIVIEITPDGHHGKVLALNEITLNELKVKDLAPNMSIGCKSLFDGEGNTIKFLSVLSELSKRYNKRQKVVEEITKEGKGWYIPSYGELYRLFSILITPDSKEQLKRLNEILKKYNGKKISRYNDYVSSTERKVRNAPVHFFGELTFEGTTLGKTDDISERLFDNRGKRGKFRLFHKF